MDTQHKSVGSSHSEADQQQSDHNLGASQSISNSQDNADRNTHERYQNLERSAFGVIPIQRATAEMIPHGELLSQSSSQSRELPHGRALNEQRISSAGPVRTGSRTSSRIAAGTASSPHSSEKNTVTLKVGLVGDAQVGKTSLMVKYVENCFDEIYTQTLGVNFMERTIRIRNTEITFSIWDLGGEAEFTNMLPLVASDAVAVLFMFDLSRKATLRSVKDWYRQARGFNRTAIPFLVGTKYDLFVDLPDEQQEEITRQAKKYARAMNAPLIFTSTCASINIQKIFKIVISKTFDLRLKIPEIVKTGEPILLYQNV